jgi:parallel beta-helix repeat protein
MIPKPFEKLLKHKNFLWLLSLVIVSLTSFQVGIKVTPAQFSGRYAYFEDMGVVADYVIDTDGISYWAIRNDGETPDGMKGTDATTVIQNTLNNGAQILLKSGTYEVSTLTLSVNTTIEGVGWATVLKLKDGVNDALLKIDSVENVRIRNMVLDANKAGNPIQSWAIWIKDGNHTEISNCKIMNATRNNITTAPSVNYVNNVLIFNNEITGADGYGIDARIMRGGAIRDNYIHDNNGGIELAGTVETTIEGNYITSNKVSGIQSNNGSYSNSIIGNHITRNTYGMRFVQGTYWNERNRIVGNYIAENGKEGILAEKLRRSEILGNTIYYNSRDSHKTYYAINLLTECFNNRIIGNYLGIGSAGGLNEAGTSNDNLIIMNEIAEEAVLRWVGSRTQVFKNHGYPTENSGTETVANNEWVPHGLATTPTVVTITVRNATYNGVPVIVGWVGQNSTHFQVSAYWTNNTAITDDVISISWFAKV